VIVYELEQLHYPPKKCEKNWLKGRELKQLLYFNDSHQTSIFKVLLNCQPSHILDHEYGSCVHLYIKNSIYEPNHPR